MKKKLPSREQFAAYVRVQTAGRWNMWSPQAQRATGLPSHVYTEIIANYDILAKAYPDVYAMMDKKTSR